LAANRVGLIEIAPDDQIAFWILGQVPHRPPQKRPVLFDLFFYSTIS